MEDKEYELINKMVVKIDEARTYNRISGLLTVIWLFEFFYTFFWTQKFDYMYWTIWGVSLVGWIHMDRKYKVAMEEYQEIKKEYDVYVDNFYIDPDFKSMKIKRVLFLPLADQTKTLNLIPKITKIFVSELTKIAIVHLYAQGIDDDRLTNFTLELTTPSKIYEQEQVELYTSKVALIQQMQQTKMFSKEWMYEAVMKMAKDEQDELTLQVLDDTKQTFRLTSIETQGVDPAKETGTEGPTNVEEELNRLKTELEEEGQVGRPKDPVRYGKDDHPEGRDPLGIKTLKQKEGSVKYKPRTNYQEIFKDMKGGKKRILTEDINKK